MGCLVVVVIWAAYLFLAYKFLGGRHLSPPESAAALGGLSVAGFITATIFKREGVGYSEWIYLWSLISLIGAIVYLNKWIF